MFEEDASQANHRLADEENHIANLIFREVDNNPMFKEISPDYEKKMGVSLAKARDNIFDGVKKSKPKSGPLLSLKMELELYIFLEKKRSRKSAVDLNFLKKKFPLLNEDILISAVRYYKQNDEWKYWRSRFIEKVLSQRKCLGVPLLAKHCLKLEEIHEQFLKANFRLVISLIKRGNYPNQIFLDKFQDGCLGLLKAVSYFDPKRKIKFSTYAVNWIWQKLARPDGTYDSDITIPFHAHGLVRKINAIKNRLESQGEASGIYAIDKAIDTFWEQYEKKKVSGDIKMHQLISKSTLRDAVSAIAAFVHIDEGLEDGEQMDVLVEDKEHLSPEEEMLKTDNREKIESMLNRFLDPREVYVIKKRFGFFDGEEHTLQDVSNDFKLTRERIRQIEGIALNKLRRHANCDVFKEILAEK